MDNNTIYQKALWGKKRRADTLVYERPEKIVDESAEQNLEEEPKWPLHEYILTPNRIKRLEFFAQINPWGFRQLWLLFQYQQYRPKDNNFNNSKHSVDKWLKDEIKDRYANKPKRNQVLRRMGLSKQKDFLEKYSSEYQLIDPTTGEIFPFNILAEAAYSNIEDLLHPDSFALLFIRQMEGRLLKMERSIWDVITSNNFVEMQYLGIDLPFGNEYFRGVRERFNGYKYNEGKRSTRPSTEQIANYWEELEEIRKREEEERRMEEQDYDLDFMSDDLDVSDLEF